MNVSFACVEGRLGEAVDFKINIFTKSVIVVLLIILFFLDRNLRISLFHFR